MERRSDKHSVLLDEALKHNTASIRRGGREARVEEFREQEGPADGEPTPDTRLQGGGEIPGAGLSLDDLDGRTDLARYLEHRKFPARPDELAAHARERHAPDGVVDQLRRAPDRIYETVSEVWEALGGRVEPRRDHNGRHD
jgi:Protein of unknown function (DUF2795)